MTFSLVARDAGADAWGVVAASKQMAVGARVAWARAGAGAIATQGHTNVAFGPSALDLMEQGLGAREVVRRLVDADPDRDVRQVGAVDAQGEAATFTGEACPAWAGGRKGIGFACQGTMLASQRVVDAMATAFEMVEGDLADRLLAALVAADEAGGDRRGLQSASLLVAAAPSNAPAEDAAPRAAIDLRADDHPDPCKELGRLLALWRLHFTPPSDRGIELRGKVRAEVSHALRTRGYLSEKEALTPEALRRFLKAEAFERREIGGMRLDRGVLDWLKRRAP